MKRQENDAKKQQFVHQIKAEFNLKSKAEWENKTDSVIEDNLVVHFNYYLL